jgi:DnaJ family protein C protein 7
MEDKTEASATPQPEVAAPAVPAERGAEAWKEEGNNRYRAKDYKGSLVSYSKAIELDGDGGNNPSPNPAYFNNRAAAYMMTLQFAEAVRDCDRAISLMPANAKAHFRKATALKALGRIDDALQSLNEGLTHDAGNAAATADVKTLTEAKAKLASTRALMERKRYRDALPQIDALQRQLGSGVWELNIMKIECLLELKRTPEAYNLTNSLMRSSTHVDVELLRLRARCFYEMGDLENAVKHLQQALRSDPDNSAVRTWYRQLREIEDNKSRGAAAYQAGNYQEAVDLWRTAVELDKTHQSVNAKLHCNCANAFAKMKKHDEAVSACDRSLRCDPHFTKAYMRRAESNFLIGSDASLQKSLNDYEKVSEMQHEDDEEEGEGKKSFDVRSKIKQVRAAIKQAKRKDLYKIIGVARDADEKDISRAYKKCALLYHPDRQSGKTEEERTAAVEKFKAVGEAYEILSDAEKKQRYDSGVEVEDIDDPHGGHGHSHGGGGGGGGHGGIDPSVLFQMFMQQQQGGGGGGRGGGRGGGGGGQSFHFG